MSTPEQQKQKEQSHPFQSLELLQKAFESDISIEGRRESAKKFLSEAIKTHKAQIFRDNDGLFHVHLSQEAKSKQLDGMLQRMYQASEFLGHKHTPTEMQQLIMKPALRIAFADYMSTLEGTKVKSLKGTLDDILAPNRNNIFDIMKSMVASSLLGDFKAIILASGYTPGSPLKPESLVYLQKELIKKPTLVDKIASLSPENSHLLSLLVLLNPEQDAYDMTLISQVVAIINAKSDNIDDTKQKLGSLQDNLKLGPATVSQAQKTIAEQKTKGVSEKATTPITPETIKQNPGAALSQGFPDVFAWLQNAFNNVKTPDGRFGVSRESLMGIIGSAPHIPMLIFSQFLPGIFRFFGSAVSVANIAHQMGNPGSNESGANQIVSSLIGSALDFTGIGKEVSASTVSQTISSMIDKDAPTLNQYLVVAQKLSGVSFDEFTLKGVDLSKKDHEQVELSLSGSALNLQQDITRIPGLNTVLPYKISPLKDKNALSTNEAKTVPQVISELFENYAEQGKDTTSTIQQILQRNKSILGKAGLGLYDYDKATISSMSATTLGFLHAKLRFSKAITDRIDADIKKMKAEKPKDEAAKKKMNEKIAIAQRAKSLLSTRNLERVLSIRASQEADMKQIDQYLFQIELGKSSV